MHRGVLSQVSPELKSLYQILEVDFHPLSITRRIEPILRSLTADPLTAAYVEPLKDVVLARLFSQLGQVYDSISLDRAIQLGSFSADGVKTTSTDRTRIERFIGAACRRGDLDVTFDHKGMVLHFDQDLFGSAHLAQQAPTESLLQPSPATLLRSQLSAVASCLYQALNNFDAATSPIAKAQQTKEEAFKAMVESMAREREALLERRSIIEQRKNQAEELAARREKEESHAKAMRAQQRAEEQARQMAEEKKRMELERQQKLAQEIKNREARLLAEKLAQSSGVKLDAVEGLDPNELVQRSVAAMEKERRDLAEKIRIVGKRMDHMERAMRKEERPLVEQDYHRQQARDAEAFQKAQEERIAEAKKAHRADLEARNRLQPHLALYEAFRADRESSSRAANEAATQASRAKIESEKAKRRASVRAARAEEARRLEEEERERAEREAEEARLAEGDLNFLHRIYYNSANMFFVCQNELQLKPKSVPLERKLSEKKESDALPRKLAGPRNLPRGAPSVMQSRRNLTSKPPDNGLAKLKLKSAEGKVPEVSTVSSTILVFEILTARIGPSVPGAASWQRSSGAAAAAPPPASSGERPRLNLQPRSRPVEQTSTPANGATAPATGNPGAYVPRWKQEGGKLSSRLIYDAINTELIWFRSTAAPPSGSTPPGKERDGFQTVPPRSGSAGGKYVPPNRAGSQGGQQRRW